MTEVRDQIVVHRDVRTVYQQWTRFEQFPEFMQGVERVEQVDDRHLHWEAKIGGAHREWEAEITEQDPEKVLAWRATGEVRNDGRVSFEAEAPDRTRVDVFAYEPQGFVEKVDDALNVIETRVRGDLERFKASVEERGADAPPSADDGSEVAGAVASNLTRPGEKGRVESAEGTVAGTRHGDSVADRETSTKGELYERAKELDVPGRSDMSKDELAEEIARHQSG